VENFMNGCFNPGEIALIRILNSRNGKQTWRFRMPMDNTSKSQTVVLTNTFNKTLNKDEVFHNRSSKSR
jgi:hypothetical protein